MDSGAASGWELPASPDVPESGAGDWGGIDGELATEGSKVWGVLPGSDAAAMPVAPLTSSVPPPGDAAAESLEPSAAAAGDTEPPLIVSLTPPEAAPLFRRLRLDVDEEPWTALPRCPAGAAEADGDDLAAWSGSGSRGAAAAALARYEAQEAEVAGAGAAAGGEAGEAAATGARGASEGEGYEREPPAVRTMLAFQARLSACAGQVVRYAWDGRPLWPVPQRQAAAAMVGWGAVAAGPGGGTRGKPASSPALRVEGVAAPACEACGARRVFELQLLPTLASSLQPAAAEDSAAEPKEAVPGPAAGGKGGFVLGGDEIDVGSAMVWSCESSCGGAGTFREWVCVVPPL